MRGKLYARMEDLIVVEGVEADRALEVEIDEAELAKLDGFQAGKVVIVETVVAAVPADGVVPASYPAFRIDDLSFGLTAITNPPPVRDTTVVRLRVGDRISLRIAG